MLTPRERSNPSWTAIYHLALKTHHLSPLSHLNYSACVQRPGNNTESHQCTWVALIQLQGIPEGPFIQWPMGQLGMGTTYWHDQWHLHLGNELFFLMCLINDSV